MSVADVEAALVGDDITLNCSATGDSPLVYQWTMQGSSTILNSDNTTGILALMDITASDFGTYVCEVSNDLTTSSANTSLELASKFWLETLELLSMGCFNSLLAVPTASPGENTTIVEGETLTLVATFEFNLALETISWTRDGVQLESGSGGATITNTDLDPPNATSTLTRSSISRSSGSGAYVVNATNRAGSETSTFNVDVFCKYRATFSLALSVCVFCVVYVDPPDVSVSATQLRLPVNGSTTLTCTVVSSNPTDFTLQWTLTNTSDVTITLNQTLQLSNIRVDQFGTYTCNVTNSASLSGQADITIEQGGT